MTAGPEFNTLTMAKVYEGQGHWEKAAEIYRHLLKNEPDREDLRQALAKLEERPTPSAEDIPPELIKLVREWLNLLMHFGRLQNLETCKSRFQALRRIKRNDL